MTNSLNNKRNSIPSFFCLLLSLVPILNGYSSGIGSFSLGMLVFSIIVFFVTINFIVIGGSKKNSFNVFLPIFLTLIFIFSSLVSYLTIDYYSKPVLSVVFAAWLKRLIWGISIVSIPTFIKYSKLCKALKVIAVISTVYLIIQNVFFYILKIPLPNIIEYGFLRPNYDYYSSSGNLSLVGTSQYRPSSFFAEPAFYGYFIILVLSTIMLGHKVKRADVGLSLFLSLGIVLSTSSGGMYILALIWVFYFIKRFKSNVKTAKSILFAFIIIVFLILFILLFNNLNILQNYGTFGEVLYKALNKVSSWNINSRLGRSFDKLAYLSGRNLFFGVGIGCNDYFLAAYSSEGYVNGIVELILQNGIFGLFLFFLYLFILFFNSKDFLIRALIIIYIIDGLYSGIYFSLFGMLYLIVIYSRKVYLDYEVA